MAEKACHTFASTTQVGLTQVLGAMESFQRIFPSTILPTLGGLLLGSTIGGLALGCFTLFGKSPSYSGFAASWAIGMFLAMFAVFYGILPALIYGAPSYAFLFKCGRANYVTSSIVGILPGLALLILQPDLAGMFLGFGALVASCTHFLAKRHPKLRQVGT